jgi:hypothetical protein
LQAVEAEVVEVLCHVADIQILLPVCYLGPYLVAEEAMVVDLVIVAEAALVDLAAEAVVAVVLAAIGNQMRSTTHSNTNSVKIIS